MLELLNQVFQIRAGLEKYSKSKCISTQETVNLMRSGLFRTPTLSLLT